MNGSAPGKLNSADWVKIAKSMAIAASGAALAYATTYVIPQLESEGQLTLAAVFSVAVNVLRKLIANNDPAPPLYR